MQTQALVPAILPVHILAGMLALVFGYVALPLRADDHAPDGGGQGV